MPASVVCETFRPLPVQLAPSAPDFVAGVTMLRGLPAPVIDVGHLLGSKASPQNWSRFVSVRAGERMVALAVDEVLGLKTLSQETFFTLPPLLEDLSQTVGRLAELDGELLLVLREAHLMPEDLWEEVLA